jgi:hypothetical protein
LSTRIISTELMFSTELKTLWMHLTMLVDSFFAGITTENIIKAF